MRTGRPVAQSRGSARPPLRFPAGATRGRTASRPAQMHRPLACSAPWASPPPAWHSRLCQYSQIAPATEPHHCVSKLLSEVLSLHWFPEWKCSYHNSAGESQIKGQCATPRPRQLVSWHVGMSGEMWEVRTGSRVESEGHVSMRSSAPATGGPASEAAAASPPPRPRRTDAPLAPRLAFPFFAFPFASPSCCAFLAPCAR